MRVINTPPLKIICLLLVVSPVMACSYFNPTQNQSLAREETSSPTIPRIPAVDVGEVSRQFLTPPREFVGTTKPIREVIVRSRTEGQLLELKVDVGDYVSKGSTIAILDDTIPRASLAKAEAELNSLKSLVAEAEAAVLASQAEVEAAKIRLAQAESDYNRLQFLYKEGAIAKREVELAETQLKSAKQALTAAQSQLELRKAAVATAKGRIVSQQAAIAEEKKRLAFTEIKSPIDGYILARLTEEGSIIQNGGEIVKIGDLTQALVEVSVSELDLEEISLGKTTRVKLDAFGGETFTGVIRRISPMAEGNTRQFPVEILLGNPQGKIKQGLLARVSFEKTTPSLVIPEEALAVSNSDNTVFVVNQKANPPRVISRQVVVGKRNNGKVEIISGLTEGEKIVIRSSQPLQDNQPVRVSAISDL